MANPIMIHVIADNGKAYLVNLNYVELVEFPSPLGTLSNNLNVERLLMQGGEILTLAPGTWEAALAALYSEFDANPQPRENVKGQLYVMPMTP